uniref:Membrane protein n=1 Tax=Bird deltacoronavirus AnasCN24 TaxID=3237947 RepID=A0AB39AG56_9NIDO
MSEANEWQIIVFIVIIWALGLILQGGYATRFRFVYIIKLILLWILQPFTLVVTIWTAVENGSHPASALFIVPVVFAILTFVSWIRYLYDSIRLVIKTKSPWSFSPESRLLACMHDGTGNMRTVPIDYLPTALCPVLVRGKFMLHGQVMATQMSLSQAPKVLYVATPSHTYHYALRKTFQDPELSDTATYIYLVEKISKADLHSVSTGSNAALYKHF